MLTSSIIIIYLKAEDDHAEMAFGWHLEATVLLYKSLKLLCKLYSLQFSVKASITISRSAERSLLSKV